MTLPRLRSNPPLAPGDRVRLTGVFLRDTGQIAGGEGSKAWTVVACSCRNCSNGSTVALNEPSIYDPEHPRHVAAVNLFRLGELTVRNCP